MEAEQATRQGTLDYKVYILYTCTISACKSIHIIQVHVTWFICQKLVYVFFATGKRVKYIENNFKLRIKDQKG